MARSMGRSVSVVNDLIDAAITDGRPANYCRSISAKVIQFAVSEFSAVPSRSHGKVKRVVIVRQPVPREGWLVAGVRRRLAAKTLSLKGSVRASSPHLSALYVNGRCRDSG